MADNTTLNAGSGGDTIAADDIAGVKHQRVKIEYGVDGAATDVSDTNPLPVDDAGGSLTVDNAALSVTGGGAEASALRVTLASDSTGVLSVDDNGGSLTVDGTVAVTSAALTTLAGAVAGTEMQVDVLTSALPSGAATAAKQPALGTAGTPSADVITVQGVTSMTPLLVNGSGVTQPVSGTVTANLAAGTNNIGDVDVLSVVPGTGATNLGKAEDAAHSTGDVGVMALAVRQTSQSSFGADGDYVPFSVDDNGGVRVSIVAGAGSGGTAAADDADFTAGTTQGTPTMGVYESSPTSVTDGDLGTVGITQTRALKVAVQGTATVTGAGGTFPVTDNAGSLTVDAPVGTPVFVRLSDGSSAIATLPVSLASVPSHAVTNAGTFAVQVDGAALTALQLLDDTVFTDDAAFTVGTSKVGITGAIVDESSTDSADEGDAVAVRATANRQLVVTVRPNANGEGLDIFRSLDLDETEEDVKTAAGKLYGWYIFNAAASTRYVKFYNATAASVTVGSTTPVLTVPIPAGSAANVEYTNGIPFSTAICVAATTGVADSDTGAPAANDVVVNIFYK